MKSRTSAKTARRPSGCRRPSGGLRYAVRPTLCGVSRPRKRHAVVFPRRPGASGRTRSNRRLGDARRSVDREQRSQTFAHFGEHAIRCSSGLLDRPFIPGDAAGLVRQDSTTEASTIGQCGLERIAAHTAGDWTDHAEPGSRIVAMRRQYDCRSPAALLVANRRIKIDPDEVAGFRTIVTRLRCQRAAPNRSLHDGCRALCRQRAR